MVLFHDQSAHNKRLVCSEFALVFTGFYTVSVSQGPNKVSRAMHGSVPPFHYLVDGPVALSFTTEAFKELISSVVVGIKIRAVQRAWGKVLG